MKKNVGDLVVYRGKHHVFLGMDITITEGGKLRILTKDQLLEAINLFEEHDGFVKDTVTSTRIKCLHIVDEECEKLIGVKRRYFT